MESVVLGRCRSWSRFFNVRSQSQFFPYVELDFGVDLQCVKKIKYEISDFY